MDSLGPDRYVLIILILGKKAVCLSVCLDTYSLPQLIKALDNGPASYVSHAELTHMVGKGGRVICYVPR